MRDGRDKKVTRRSNGSGAPGRLRRVELVALGAGVLWFAFWAVQLLFAPEVGGLDALLTLTIVVLPLCAAWIAIRLAQVRRLALAAGAERAELTAILHRVEAALARSIPAEAPGPANGDAGLRDTIDHLIELQSRGEARITERIGEVNAALRALEAAPASKSSRSPRPSTPDATPSSELPPEPPDGAETDDQPRLELEMGADDDGQALLLEDFIAALQFPADANDDAGFRALRRALQDRRAAQLVTAAQDVLTLLSQSGIYMDDFDPVPAPPRTWRLFAGGQRGHAVAAIGAIRDRDAMAKVATRMREDAIFRDAAHHFLRLFDGTLAELEPVSSDAEIAALSETRSARAFMLLGRVARMFG